MTQSITSINVTISWFLLIFCILLFPLLFSEDTMIPIYILVGAGISITLGWIILMIIYFIKKASTTATPTPKPTPKPTPAPTPKPKSEPSPAKSFSFILGYILIFLGTISLGISFMYSTIISEPYIKVGNFGVVFLMLLMMLIDLK